MDEDIINKNDDFIIGAYYSALSTDKDVAMNYLHQSNTWQITIFSGAIFACFVQDGFPNLTTLLISSVALVSTINFLTRTARAYLNVLRWSTIERHILNLTSCSSSTKLTELKDQAWNSIETYHVQWRSPIVRSEVLKKVLFEFGYAFQILLIFTVMATSLYNDFSLLSVVVIIGMLLFSFMEFVFGFWRSPYFSRVQPDAVTRSLR